jgi:tetratricopeptide (TPR) repeat protein
MSRAKIMKDLLRISAAIALIVNLNSGVCLAQAAPPIKDISTNTLQEPILLIEMAQAFVLQNDYDRAILVADQAIAEAPQSPMAHHVRGKAFLAAKTFKRAAHDFLTAHGLYNARAKSTFQRYEALSTAGDHSAAAMELSVYLALTKSGLEAMDDLDKADTEQSSTFTSRGPQHDTPRPQALETAPNRRLGATTW